jgi:hypothetical protein
MNTVTRTVGGAFGGAITASILAGSVGITGYPSSQGFTIAFASCALALGLGVLVGLAIPQRRPADAFAPHEVGDISPGTDDVLVGDSAENRHHGIPTQTR